MIPIVIQLVNDGPGEDARASRDYARAFVVEYEFLFFLYG